MDDNLIKRLDKLIMLDKEIRNDLREIKDSLGIKPKNDEPLTRYRDYENYKYNVEGDNKNDIDN